MSLFAKAVCRAVGSVFANLLVLLCKAIGPRRLSKFLNRASVVVFIHKFIRLVADKKIRWQEQNLQKVLGLDPNKIAQQSTIIDRGAITTVVESITMDGSHIDKTQWFGLEHLDGLESSGVLFVGAHINNWEICRRNLDLKGYPCRYLYRDYSSTWFDHRTVNRGARHGELGISTARTPVFVEHLKSGGKGFMLLDLKDKGRNGLRVDFCGLPAWTTSFPAQMAKQHGVKVIPVVLKRTTAGYEQHLFPPANHTDSKIDITRYLNCCIGDEILAAPETWLLWDTNRWGP